MGKWSFSPKRMMKYPPRHLSLKEWKEVYKTSYQKIQESTGVEVLKTNPVECMFIGYGLDCIHMVQKNFHKKYTLEETNLIELEKLMEAYHGGLIDGDFEEYELQGFYKMFAGYVGLVVMTNLGGHWVPQVEGEERFGPAVVIDGPKKNIDFFILSRVRKRIVDGLIGDGSNSSILLAYDTIKEKLK